MKTYRIKSILALTFWMQTLLLFAQMEPTAPKVLIEVEGNAFALPCVSTQSEVKTGWDIQGYNVGRHNLRYLWGKKAKQVTGTLPCFHIYPTETLNNYIILQLKKKKAYRKFPKFKISECQYVRIELGNFKISNLPDMGFKVVPSQPLSEGEYVIIDTSQQGINKFDDIQVYEFSVSK